MKSLLTLLAAGVVGQLACWAVVCLALLFVAQLGSILLVAAIGWSIWAAVRC